MDKGHFLLRSSQLLDPEQTHNDDDDEEDALASRFACRTQQCDLCNSVPDSEKTECKDMGLSVVFAPPLSALREPSLTLAFAGGVDSDAASPYTSLAASLR